MAPVMLARMASVYDGRWKVCEVTAARIAPEVMRVVERIVVGVMGGWELVDGERRLGLCWRKSTRSIEVRRRVW